MYTNFEVWKIELFQISDNINFMKIYGSTLEILNFGWENSISENSEYNRNDPLINNDNRKSKGASKLESLWYFTIVTKN